MAQPFYESPLTAEAKQDRINQIESRIWNIELDIEDLKAYGQDTTQKQKELDSLKSEKDLLTSSDNAPYHPGYDSNLGSLNAPAASMTNQIEERPTVPQQHLEFPQQHLEYPQQHLEFPQQHLEFPQQRLEIPQQHLEIPQQHLEFSEVAEQQASLPSRKRELSEPDEPYTSEPPHKSQRTSKWDSDDEMGDSINNVIDLTSSPEKPGILTPNDTDEEKELCETPEEVQCTLYKHQLMGLQWMMKQENDKKKKGGILADDMGLGKTLTTIALMVSRKANHSSVKTNLIVAPVALLKQWQREIEQKIKAQHKFSVFIMHGNSKADYTQLREYDVVLTTYGKITSEYSRLDEYIRKAQDKKRNTDNDYLSQLCPLIGPLSHFHRIILDEAQCIKNPKSKGAKAVSQLKAQYRWCLSGTPMMNGPKELASLIHFLRIKPYDSISLFQGTFKCLDPKVNAARNAGNRKRALHMLRVLLSSIMLRRTKDQKIDGKPIVDLKEKIMMVDYAVFDDDERDFYNTLEKNSRVEFSKYYRAGLAGRNITKILILLLRLRQACCHPHLHLLDAEAVDPSISDDRMVETAKALSSEIVQRTKEADNFGCSVCSDVRTTMNIMSPCGEYVCTPCVEAFLELAKQQSIEAGNEGGNTKGLSTCPKCKESARVVTYDAFKKVHMHEGNSNINDNDFDSDSDDSGSESDDDDIDIRGNLKGFIVNDDADEEYIDEDDSDGLDIAMNDLPNDVESADRPKNVAKKAGSKAKRNHKKTETPPLALLRDKAKGSQNSRKRYMKELRRILLPSSKVTKCLEIISTIQKTTGEKIIIFSQWTFLLDILEVSITDQLGVSLCRFDGSMSAGQRDDSANEFTTNPDVKVILVSLKAGNAGLNLTAASQVILMDPFWNPYIENQAVDRSYRIGQQRDVTVHRILIEGTVEDRIVSIQEKKRQIVESALNNEKAAKSMASLGVDDLAYIFGGKD